MDVALHEDAVAWTESIAYENSDAGVVFYQSDVS